MLWYWVCVHVNLEYVNLLWSIIEHFLFLFTKFQPSHKAQAVARCQGTEETAPIIPDPVDVEEWDEETGKGNIKVNIVFVYVSWLIFGSLLCSWAVWYNFLKNGYFNFCNII